MKDRLLELKSWIIKMQPLWVLLAPSLLIGAVAGAYPGYRLYSWTWKDASFCVTCHVHDYAQEGWKRSAHSKLTTCHDCHHQPLRAYLTEVYMMATKPPHFPKDLHHTPHVPRDLCESCHVSHPKDQSNISGPLSAKEIAQIPKIDNTRLHRLHLAKRTKKGLPSTFFFDTSNQKDYGTNEGAEGHQGPEHENGAELGGGHGGLGEGEGRPIACVDCHGTPANRAHQFTAVDQSCLHCHEGQSHKAPFLKETGCRNCHFQEFLIQKL